MTSFSDVLRSDCTGIGTTSKRIPDWKTVSNTSFDGRQSVLTYMLHEAVEIVRALRLASR